MLLAFVLNKAFCQEVARSDLLPVGARFCFIVSGFAGIRQVVVLILFCLFMVVAVSSMNVVGFWISILEPLKDCYCCESFRFFFASSQP